MKRIVKSIRFPDSLLEEIRPVMKKSNLNFTEFIIESIKTYIRVQKHNEGITKSFGAWKKGNHPELKKGTANYLRKIRKGRNI